ncbi:AAA family ATPase [Telmatocola sphagniphila]|uniref:AAA family ATPase n=1 Tax=Telmatocola sphagniphila TaxID=1123043 RepID=A0A8E6B8G6_9BACT|nr:AAA family ATPase [Telmatocola sphagniphila]QVL33691.1 AAA family ATPase [Telmatocola sphagniphila]
MIRLESLHISRFRGIREGKIEGFTDVNILVGKNNSGKTTVMEAIMRCIDSWTSMPDIMGRDVPNTWSEIRKSGTPSIISDFWYQQDLSTNANLSITLKNADTNSQIQLIRFSVTYSKDTHGNLNALPQGDSVHVTGNWVTFRKGLILIQPEDCRNSRIEELFWQSILSNRRDKILLKNLNEVFGLNAEALQLIPPNKLMVLYDNYGIPLDVLGDGTRSALRALILLSMVKSCLVLMEEPECYQHPGSLEKFALAVTKLAQQQQIQLILSTHSIECVNAFLKAAKTVASNAAVFHLSVKDGHQIARKLETETVETLESTGIDVRFADLYA